MATRRCGVDDAVARYEHFMQSTYKDAPAPVLLRLYADFVLAARKDMGDPETQLTVEHILGMKIKDF